MTIALTSEEAEEILIGLCWRSRQKGLGDLERHRIAELGRKLSATFEVEFGANPGWFGRINAMDRQIVVKTPPVITFDGGLSFGE